MLPTTKLELFAGIPVAHFARSRTWYERLLGSPPSFLPHETEAVWQLANHRYLYIVEEPEHAGHARLTCFVEGLEALLAGIGQRGLAPVGRETYPNGVQKISYRDPDGNEVGFGGATKPRTPHRLPSNRGVRSSTRHPRGRARQSGPRPGKP